MYLGFVLDEKNTIFSIVAVHMGALQEIHLLYVVDLMRPIEYVMQWAISVII